MRPRIWLRKPDYPNLSVLVVAYIGTGEISPAGVDISVRRYCAESQSADIADARAEISDLLSRHATEEQLQAASNSIPLDFNPNAANQSYREFYRMLNDRLLEWCPAET